jgi:adenosylcobinamide-GDP ribazoletransferase
VNAPHDETRGEQPNDGPDPRDETRGEQRDDGPDPRDETDDAPRDDTGGALRDGVRLAWGTLTAIPGPAPLRVDAAVARVAMAGAWLVVLPLTLACALTGWVLVLLGVPATAAGFLTIGALSWATRAIHADGLADTADGIGSGRARERALEIMRLGNVGPMGAVTLVLVYGAQAVLLGDLLTRPAGWALAGLALASGRLALALGCASLVPAARHDGLGQAMAGAVPTWLLGVTVAVNLAVGVLVGVLAGLAGPAVPWWGWPLALLLGGLAAVGVLVRALQRLGGITGDVLGALVEAATLGLLLALSMT